MIWRITLFTFLATTTAVEAQSTRLEALQAQRNGAIERAVAPINDKYVSELTKLLKATITAGELDKAVEIREEIERFEKAPPKPSVFVPRPQEKFSERWLYDTEWVSVVSNQDVMRKFHKGVFNYYDPDGNGGWNLREGSWKWEIVSEAERTIKITYFSAGEEIVQFSEDLKTMGKGSVTPVEWTRVEK